MREPEGVTWLEISWSLEPRAPLNSPVAPSNLWREPKDVHFGFYTQDPLKVDFEDAIGLSGNEP